MVVGVGVGMIVLIGGRQVTVRRRTRKIMLVKMKPTEKQQHEDEAGQRPDHDRVNCAGRDKGMRYQMEQGHAQHEPGYQTQYHLGAIVGHAQQSRQPTPQQGGKEQRSAIQQE